MPYALAVLREDDAVVPVVEVGDVFYRISDIAPDLSVDPARGLMDLFADWDATQSALEKGIALLDRSGAKAITPPAGTDFAPPLTYPGKIVCTGVNYYDHLRLDAGIPDFDKSRFDILYFLKHSRALVGSGGSVRFPSQSKQLDWEVELVVVFGKQGRRIAVENAMDYIAGYAIGIDLSARDWQFNDRHVKQFDLFTGKSFDDSAPMGPKIVPAKFVDPAALELKLWVNGDIKQDSTTDEMIWSIPEQIAELSRHMTIEPGDILFTGSPAGVGHATHSFLGRGDKVTARITGLGSLEFEIIADPDEALAAVS